MEQHGVDPLYIRAMECHGYGQCTDTRPESLLEKDPVHGGRADRPDQRGLPGAPLQKCAGPGSQVGEKEAEGQDICRRVNRDVIRQGAEMLGTPLDDVIRETIEGMKEHAEEIGLKGSL